MNDLEVIVRHKYRRTKHKLRFYLGLEDRKEWFSTVGLSSEVIEEGETIGHVTFLDIEGASFTEVRNVCAENFDSFWIFSSSKSSFHVINPVIRSKDEARELMHEIDIQDENHTQIGYDRGDWVLRISDKPDKPKPVLLYSNTTGSHSVTYSEPHLKYLELMGASEDVEFMRKHLNTAGKSFNVVKYFTFK